MGHSKEFASPLNPAPTPASSAAPRPWPLTLVGFSLRRTHCWACSWLVLMGADRAGGASAPPSDMVSGCSAAPGCLRPLDPVSFQGLGMLSLLVLPLGAPPPLAFPLVAWAAPVLL